MARATSRLFAGAFLPPKSPARLSFSRDSRAAALFIAKCSRQLPRASKWTPRYRAVVTVSNQDPLKCHCPGGFGTLMQSILNLGTDHCCDHRSPYLLRAPRTECAVCSVWDGIIESSRYIAHVISTSPTLVPAPTFLNASGRSELNSAKSLPLRGPPCGMPCPSSTIS